MALADIIRFFHDWPDHPLAGASAPGATIHMIPMLNPDGAERFRRRNAQGIDVNRDARALQTPEGQLLKRVDDELQPDFGFNLHDQNAAVRVGRSDRGVAIALLAPAFDSARDVDTKRRRAMQVASLLVRAMDPMVGGHIAKYDDTLQPPGLRRPHRQVGREHRAHRVGRVARRPPEAVPAGDELRRHSVGAGRHRHRQLRRHTTQRSTRRWPTTAGGCRTCSSPGGRWPCPGFPRSRPTSS